jgi:serine/threonine-protein kinase
MRILNDEPPSLGAVPGVPDWLAKLVSQLLRKNPKERPQTATEVLRRLERATATSDGAPTRVLPFPQWFAHPRVARLALLLVGAGVLAVALPLFFYFVVRSRAPSPSAQSIKSVASAASVAVLPFASLSSGEENAYFAQGFHDELLRHLGRIGDLRVISRTSVMQYKDSARNLREIAEALDVSSIVEGSVQRAGNRVRVEARLIDARSDRQMWGERYDRDVTDTFAIQTAVAEEVASALNARLSVAQKVQIERKPTQSAEAYDLYLRALQYANRPEYEPESLQIAQRLYQQAIQADPSFALARARFASLKMLRYKFVAGTPDSVVEEAREEAEHALRLQPDLPEAHLALGLYHYWGRRADDRALREFETARAGLPAETINYIGAVQRRQGKFDDAIRSQYQAVQLDPRSPRHLFELATSLQYTRRYEEADRVLDRALTIAPDFIAARVFKALVHQAWKGETDLARAVLRDARGRLDPRGRLGQQGWIVQLLEQHPAEALPLLDSVDSDSLDLSIVFYPKAFFHAVAHEVLGNAALARKEYEAARVMFEAEVEKHIEHPPIAAFQHAGLARAYAGLGRKEDALREARRAVEILPISKDATDGSWLEIHLAAVEARVGETDAAIKRIRRLLSIPSRLSPAVLRTEARWAPLRDDPRFRQLAELEPR